VAQSHAAGAITFVEYSYALNAGFPVAKILNNAGYYVEPTASNVAVALLAARINQNADSPDYLTQDLSGVYVDPDKRTYPLSSYSYIVLPTAIESGFTNDKGLTLADFGAYFLCEGQQQAETLGYSPLPVNLVLAGQDQIEKIPGGNPSIRGVAECHNPTLDPADPNGNALAAKAPNPSECDKRGSTQCVAGTGGARDTPLDQTANNSSGEGISGGEQSSTPGVDGTTGGTGGGSDEGAGGGSGAAGQADTETETGGPALAGDSEVVLPGEDAALVMAAASPQQIPAPVANPATRLATLAAGAGVLAAAVVPPIAAKRASRRRPKLPRLEVPKP
jgi:hypothetical protein